MDKCTYSASFFIVVALGADAAEDAFDTLGVINSLRKSSFVSGWTFLVNIIKNVQSVIIHPYFVIL